MRVLLCRHGETPWNAEGRYQGQMDIPLSPIGEAQATALGARLKELPIARAIASPLSRARRTAELALGSRAGMLTTDAGFLEIAHGAWEGKLAAEIAAEDGPRLKAWREAPDTVQMPGGESLQQVLDRAWPAFVSACAGLGADEILLLAAHDAVNRVLLARILGLPLARIWSFRQAPATLNLLEGPDPTRLEVVRLNDAAHVTGLFGEALHRAL
ncbi:MAG TPA: histidine phosphatase family protein [Holophagaceae bacterium]|jgi:broad specificity phosphatase PhoE|nr:histidine phosphatase family protein [Holophagaceae bacterium]